MSWLRRRHEGAEDVAFMEELGLCRGEVSVDVATVNGSLVTSEGDCPQLPALLDQFYYPW
jgi:hypothetical protein